MSTDTQAAMDVSIQSVSNSWTVSDQSPSKPEYGSTKRATLKHTFELLAWESNPALEQQNSKADFEFS